MFDWAKENTTMIFMIVGGIFVSILASESHSPKVAIARVSSGLFCSIAFPGIFMEILGLNPDVYGNAVAGLFAMMGYSLARMVVNIDKNTVLDLISAFRGKKS